MCVLVVYKEIQQEPLKMKVDINCIGEKKKLVKNLYLSLSTYYIKLKLN